MTAVVGHLRRYAMPSFAYALDKSRSLRTLHLVILATFLTT